MTTIPQYSKNSPVLLFLLFGIFIALVFLIGALLWPKNGGGNANPQTNGQLVYDGQTVTRADLKAQGLKPSEPSPALPDTNRILQMYKAGKKYRTTAKATLKNRASLKDWGVVTDMNMNYGGEFEVMRSIEENDGTTITEVREFTKVRSLVLFCKLEDARIDIGFPGQAMLAGLDWYSGTPGIWSSLQGLSAKKVLETVPSAQNWADQVLTDNATKAFARIDSLQGKKVRLQYVNGKGVTHLTPIGCSLTSDEQEIILETAVLSDAYLLPDPTCKEGDQWSVLGSELLPVIDPSLRASLSGSLTVRRGPNGGTVDQPTARLILDRGSLELNQVSNSSKQIGRWAPRGNMTYSFNQQIVISGQMGGEVHFERNSTDHLLFEARYTHRPDYLITYQCEVLP